VQIAQPRGDGREYRVVGHELGDGAEAGGIRGGVRHVCEAGAVPGHTLARGKYVKDLDHPPVRALADLGGEDSPVEDGRREDQDVPRGHPQLGSCTCSVRGTAGMSR
jgi:hypothetical protein